MNEALLQGPTARELEPSRDELPADVGVREVLGLMLTGQWRPGESDVLTAARHGVSASAVRRWREEAARFIRLCWGSEDEIRARSLAEIENVKAEARSLGDLRAWTKLKELELRVAGIAVEKPAPALAVQVNVAEYFERQTEAA